MQPFQSQFLARVEEFLRSQKLLTPNARVILAVSGGVDSMTMLHLFLALQPSWKLSLTVAHVNHQLRGEESDADEAFVCAAANEWNVPVVSRRVPTLQYAHGVGKQAAARALRYQFFEELRQEIRADAIATAHTADDNAETVLMNALRGSGVHGLAGIPVRRDEGRIIRPLLFAYRSEIERYARETGIRFRTDSSNSSLAYTRNVVRMSLMPLLQQQCEANIAQSLNRLSAVMREAEGQLSTQTDAVYHQIVTTRQTRTMVNIPRLRSQSPLVQDEILLRVFRQLGVEPQRGKLLHVLQLCEAQTGKTMSLTKTIRVLRDRDHLCFDDASQAEPFAYPVVLGQEYEFPSFRFAARLRKTVPQQFSRRATTEFVDAERLGKNLVLRNWREGDWFMPLGLHGKKKLSDFFVDEKVPRTDKHCIPVLESDGSIVWVCGYRLDERFMVTSQTSTAVELHYCPHTS